MRIVRAGPSAREILRVDAATRAAACSVFDAEVGVLESPPVRAIRAWIFETVPVNAVQKDLAVTLGCRADTLALWFVRASLPAPVRWHHAVVVLRVAAVLQIPHITVVDLARALGAPSSQGIYRLVATVAGEPWPRWVARVQQDRAHALQQFKAMLVEHRDGWRRLDAARWHQRAGYDGLL
ncbi:MAG: hypothetical protein ACYC1W_06885 [Gemmatimonadaceae bacterium]